MGWKKAANSFIHSLLVIFALFWTAAPIDDYQIVRPSMLFSSLVINTLSTVLQYHVPVPVPVSAVSYSKCASKTGLCATISARRIS